jgi:hypothetical protein
MSATTDVIVHHFHDLRGFHHEVLDGWADDTDWGGHGGGVGGTSDMAVLLLNVAHDDWSGGMSNECPERCAHCYSPCVRCRTKPITRGRA